MWANYLNSGCVAIVKITKKVWANAATVVLWCGWVKTLDCGCSHVFRLAIAGCCGLQLKTCVVVAVLCGLIHNLKPSVASCILLPNCNIWNAAEFVDCNLNKHWWLPIVWLKNVTCRVIWECVECCWLVL